MRRRREREGERYIEMMREGEERLRRRERKERELRQ